MRGDGSIEVHRRKSLSLVLNRVLHVPSSVVEDSS